jgi:GxxExxY protein
MDQNGIKAELAPGRFTGTENELTEQIIGVFYKVYNELGFGFIESVYRESMAIALTEAGLSIVVEAAIPVTYHGKSVGTFRADIMVERKVYLELKTADQISKAHEAQVLHYLRASNIEVGLILAFGSAPAKRRIEFRNERKQHIARSVFIPS